jgi:hypothetical protein
MAAAGQEQWNSAIERGYKMVVAILGATDWEEESKDFDLTVYRRKAPFSRFLAVKTVVDIGRAPHDVLEYMKNVRVVDRSTPKDLREGCIERRVLQTVDDDSRFLYVCIDPESKLVDKRDFLIFERIFRDGEKTFLVRKSIVDDSILAPVRGCVRGTLLYQAYVIEPGWCGTQLTFVGDADPRGDVHRVIYDNAMMKQARSVLRAKGVLHPK